MRERMTDVQEERRRLDNQKELHKQFLRLFPDEEATIKKGKFVDQIPIRGDGSPAVGDVFIYINSSMYDPYFAFWNIERLVVTGKENDVLQVHTAFYRENNLIREDQLFLQDNLVVNSELKEYFDNQRNNYAVSYVKELFLYPPNTEKKQTA